MATTEEPRPLADLPLTPVGGEPEESTDSAPNTTGEQITIFHNAENFTVKHPLMNKWTLWFTKPPSSKASLISSSWVPAAGG